MPTPHESPTHDRFTLSDPLKTTALHLQGKTQQIIRQHPLTSISFAFAAGLFLSSRLVGVPTAKAISTSLGKIIARSLLTLAKPTALHLVQQSILAKINHHIPNHSSSDTSTPQP